MKSARLGGYEDLHGPPKDHDRMAKRFERGRRGAQCMSNSFQLLRRQAPFRRDAFDLHVGERLDKIEGASVHQRGLRPA